MTVGTTRGVLSPSGPTHVTLAVTEHGAPATEAAAHVVLLHGFPERQQMWGPVLDRLTARAPDLHLVTYDYRGAGASTVPPTKSEYAVAHLVSDLVAVLDATVPTGRPVHLVGHDWGSVQLWEALAAEAAGDPRLRGRLASYTSVSGPPLDHLGDVVRGRHVSRAAALRQALHSWYVYLFLVPGLAEQMWDRGQGVTRGFVGRIDPTLDALAWGPGLAHDARHAVNLYRANVARVLRPRRWRTSVPVQVVVAERDGFVTPTSLDGLEGRCPDLVRERLDVGHFLVPSHGAELADLVLAHVRRHGTPGETARM
ncbi:MAG: alpha/beta fold hydrolase [Nocardioides sp.]|nr:alpha/beta fold hydrolase [Nocardioides sp.]